MAGIFYMICLELILPLSIKKLIPTLSLGGIQNQVEGEC